MDVSNENVLDILPDRRLSLHKSYFFRFPLDVKEQIEPVWIDMYEPYFMNAVIFPYSNGWLEGPKNLIKVIKQIDFVIEIFITLNLEFN